MLILLIGIKSIYILSHPMLILWKAKYLVYTMCFTCECMLVLYTEHFTEMHKNKNESYSNFVGPEFYIHTWNNRFTWRRMRLRLNITVSLYLPLWIMYLLVCAHGSPRVASGRWCFVFSANNNACTFEASITSVNTIHLFVWLHILTKVQSNLCCGMRCID